MATTDLADVVERTALDGQWLRKAAVYVSLYGAAALFLVPYAWLLSLSLRTSEEALSTDVHWIPHQVTFANYVELLSNSMVPRWTLNTLLIAGATTLLVLVVDSMAAFALTRLEWPGRNLVVSVVVASFMVPAVINLVPVYTLISDLGLVNTYYGVILPVAAGPLWVFLFVQFFRDIPDELQEAARLDGFSHFQFYLRVILPLSRPVMTAVGLFQFVSSWNMFLWPLIVLQDDSAFTLPIGLVASMANRQYEPHMDAAMAVVVAAPLFVLFLFMQQHLVRAVELQGTVE